MIVEIYNFTLSVSKGKIQFIQSSVTALKVIKRYTLKIIYHASKGDVYRYFLNDAGSVPIEIR
jgi:hypothetical protein